MMANGLLRAGLAIVGSLTLVGCAAVGPKPSRERADLAIVGGTVFDGTLTDGHMADVIVEGGKIIAVGEGASRRYTAARSIDAAGLIVAPGFIDPHTHADADLASAKRLERANLPFAYQGVTTVVVGNDGFGPFAIAKQADAARAAGVGTNVAYLAGFGPIREASLGKAAGAPDSGELGEMRARLHEAMCEGAWGFSAGLYYAPQAYASTGEVVELARIAGAAGGYYDTHLRDESTYSISVTGAVAETLEIGRRAGVPVHISHIKALGPAVWGKSAGMIAMIEEARENGQRVTADQYPWAASGTRISNALVPRWALEGGLEALREKLADPAQRARIRSGMIEGLARRGGPDKLLVTSPLGGAPVASGETLDEIAAGMGLDAVDAAVAILEKGDARVASFNMSEADIAEFAGREWVVTGSDGSAGHPRKYASFPKAYRDLVVNGEMSLARFVQRSSAQTAEIVGLADRGYLKPGFAADIVLIDLAQFAPRATYRAPEVVSAGVRFLIVNGEALIDAGQYTGALPGAPLLKDTSC